MSEAIIKSVWPDWKPIEKIGKGSYGTVYKCLSVKDGKAVVSAVKVISIPQDESEVRTLISEGMSNADTHTYFRNIVSDFINEIAIMEKCRGAKNIVNIDDYLVVEAKNKIGWVILIRMEFLMPFDVFITRRPPAESDVIRFAKDMSKALVVCKENGIIHRDIKPENIFVSSDGAYKLGDFGIAKNLEGMASSHSQKGTFNYIAPEVARGTHYDGKVDIYSLGIVLYKLMNNGFLPYLNKTNCLNPSERKHALDRRLGGQQIPPPAAASKDMSDFILKCCAYDPNERFADPKQMLSALEKLGTGSKELLDIKNPIKEPTNMTIDISFGNENDESIPVFV